jgi:iron-sulfur cluster repair protein YtfE (RIC family)
MVTAMNPSDPIEELTHDHRHLTELVFIIRDRLAVCAADGGGRAALLSTIEQLQDELITHAAREEEGLFPFVAENAPSLEARAFALQAAHDTICGTVSRLAHAAQEKGEPAVDLAMCREVFARFEACYARHAREESAFLEELGAILDDRQRRELHAALAGL